MLLPVLILFYEAPYYSRYLVMRWMIRFTLKLNLKWIKLDCTIHKGGLTTTRRRKSESDDVPLVKGAECHLAC